jgi:hypothetical protein
VADSDNARLTLPVDEIVAQQRMVMLPGQRDGAAGEKYGREFEKPLVGTAAPYAGGAATVRGGAPRRSAATHPSR